MKIKIENRLTFPSAYRARPDYIYMADDGEVKITDDMLTNDIVVIRLDNNSVEYGSDFFKTFVNNTSTPLLVGISDYNENNTINGKKSNFFGIFIPEVNPYKFDYRPCKEIMFVPQGGEFDVEVDYEGESGDCHRYAFCVSVGIPYFAKGEN